MFQFSAREVFRCTCRWRMSARMALVLQEQLLRSSCGERSRQEGVTKRPHRRLGLVRCGHPRVPSGLVIEVFAGTGRVTACLKHFGMTSAFGTDHVRHKQAMSAIAIADLTKEAGVNLLMQWLSDRRVVGLFLAPPCGSASRARAIPLKKRAACWQKRKKIYLGAARPKASAV